MAYDPSVLRSMLSPPPAFGGQAHGAPTSPTGGAGQQQAQQQQQPQAEPVALHDASVKAQEACAAARAALEDLAAQAEMAETIDPAVEKSISDASDSMGECDDAMQEIVASLLSAREEHDEMASGEEDKGA